VGVERDAGAVEVHEGRERPRRFVTAAGPPARSPAHQREDGCHRMNSQLVIDAIVRQTIVLISQLATAQGASSPLARVAEQALAGLVRELEEQGLGEEVIADLFGLGLRAYRRRVQRLRESVTSRGVTLTGAVHAFLAERDAATRAELRERFAQDDEGTLRGVLDDLVDSGLVRRVGRGREARYRVATAEELEELGALGASGSSAASEAVVWVHVCRAGPLRQEELAALLPLSPAALAQALSALVADGRVRVESRPDGEVYSTDRCLIPVGDTAGWEAAIVDHHRAVLAALGAKVASGRHGSAPDDEVGGTTICFDLWPGHPREQEVRAILADTRRRLAALWEAVEDENRDRGLEITYKITFYYGQFRTDEEQDQ